MGKRHGGNVLDADTKGMRLSPTAQKDTVVQNVLNGERTARYKYENAHIQDFLGCARFLLSDFNHLHHAVPTKDIDLVRGADRLPAFGANQLAGAAGAFAARCGAGSCLGCSSGGSRADKGR